MARSQHCYQFLALCLKHRRAMKEAAEIIAGGCGLRGSWSRIKGGRKRHRVPHRAEERQVIVSSIPTPGAAGSRDTAGPAAGCPRASPLAPTPSACKSGKVIRTGAARPLWQQPDCWSPEASHSPPAGGVFPHEHWKSNSPRKDKHTEVRYRC